MLNRRLGVGYRPQLRALSDCKLALFQALTDSNWLASIRIYYSITFTTSDLITWSSAYLYRCVSNWQLGQGSICNINILFEAKSADSEIDSILEISFFNSHVIRNPIERSMWHYGWHPFLCVWVPFKESLCLFWRETHSKGLRARSPTWPRGRRKEGPRQ